MTEHIDSTATELVPVEQAAAPSSTLFHTNDPVEVVEQASRVADALKRVLKKQGLTKSIQGKDHVLVEGWTTLGSMLGVVPVVVWSKPTENGWEARVEARTLDGRVIGAAEAQCLRDERRWKSADDYAVRSMAQTRATSKALRGPLGFIVTLAGFSATPEEEMPGSDGPARVDVQQTGASDIPADPVEYTPPPDRLTPGQYKTIVGLFQQAGHPVEWLQARIIEYGGSDEGATAERVGALTGAQADKVEIALRERIAADKKAAKAA